LKASIPPPVIVMTAHLFDYASFSGELQRNGVRECITKPFTNAIRPLSAVIEGLLEACGPRAKFSAWLERSSSSVPTIPERISWWQGECDLRSATIQKSFGRTGFQIAEVI
jgi:hypothetical protein